MGVFFTRNTPIELYVLRVYTDTKRFHILQSTRIGTSIVSLATLRRAGDAPDAMDFVFSIMHVVALIGDSTKLSWMLECAFNLGTDLGWAIFALEAVVEFEKFGDPGRKVLRGRTSYYGTLVLRTDYSERCIAILALGQAPRATSAQTRLPRRLLFYRT